MCHTTPKTPDCRPKVSRSAALLEKIAATWFLVGSAPSAH
ncbi:Uncharacterised protein [Vibrio cholerae]|nr:Uncharacterised protein [Vibrio cholerae]